MCSHYQGEWYNAGLVTGPCLKVDYYTVRLDVKCCQLGFQAGAWV